jgi:hypothetical protein
MNFSTSSTEINKNQTDISENVYVFDSLDEAVGLYFSRFGDYFWDCAFFPTTVIGFFLNLLNFMLFWKKEFNIKFFTYF